MKNFIKVIGISLLAATTAVQAELSASVGVDSAYIYRAIELDDSITVSANVAYSVAGFTVSAAMIDANAGDDFGAGIFETDLSIAYTANIAGQDISLSYTDFSYDFGGDIPDMLDRQELTLSTSIMGLGISYTDGNSSDEVIPNGIDFSVITVDYTLSNVNILIGKVDSDSDIAQIADYSFFEISSTVAQVVGLDVSLTYSGTFSEHEESFAGGEANNAFVIGLSKGFDL